MVSDLRPRPVFKFSFLFFRFHLNQLYCNGYLPSQEKEMIPFKGAGNLGSAVQGSGFRVALSE
ncbi:hypothetical protein ACFL2S_12355, partial [Thermodesulfobacteriota bacterium]